MRIAGIDHVVLTVASLEKTLWFYCQVLGMQEIIFAEGRRALLCGKQKINLHLLGKEYEPKAFRVTPGSLDLCLIVSTPLEEVIWQLKEQQIEIVEGPEEKIGALGKMVSVYVRDPDLNLIELSNYP